MQAAKQELVDYMAILRGVWRRHKALVVCTFLGIAVPLLVIVQFTDRPLYVSTATISIEPSVLDQIPFLRDPVKRDTRSAHMVLLKSRSLSHAVIEALPREGFDELLRESQYTDYLLLLKNTIKPWLGQPPTVLSPEELAMAELQMARMEFLPSKEAPNIIVISATATRPRIAMELVNAYIQVLLNRTRSVDQDEARRAREFLEQQFQQAKENVARAEETIAGFQQRKGRVALRGQTELDLVRLSQLENSLAETQANRQILSARIAALRGPAEQLKSKGARTSKEVQADSLADEKLASVTAFKRAQDQLAKLEAKLSTLRERYTEAHPLVQVTQDEVIKQQALVAQMARQLPTMPSTKGPAGSSMISSSAEDLSDAVAQLASLEKESGNLEAKEASLNLQLTRLRGGLHNLNQDEMQFGNMHRSLEVNRSLLSALSDKLMATRIREQGEPGVIRIVDPASLPSLPTGSKTQKLVLMVLGLAGSLAFGSAFGLEFWRQPIETETDVTKATGLPVLGSVAAMKRPRAGGRGQRESQSSRPLFDPNLSDRSANANIQIDLYRAIRANVETERLKSPFRSILVTSPGPHEGKSTTTLNLAHVFQEFGRRVLLVEADLRRPSLPTVLALTNKPGLVDYLCGIASFEQVCRTLPSGVTVIPGQVTRKDVASLLASTYVRELLYHASTRFDLVLVDSAPILAVPDNLLLVAALDRVILVAKSTATSIRDLRKAKMVLENANSQILGVILNQAHPRDVPYYHPRYQKYYKVIDAKTPPNNPSRIGIAGQPDRHQARFGELANEKKES